MFTPFYSYFLYKGLPNNGKPEHVSTIIDDKNKFMEIVYKTDTNHFIWKDIFRIYPVSFNDVC